jgi:predicted DNA-binding transcriptional regulator AlpA
MKQQQPFTSKIVEAEPRASLLNEFQVAALLNVSVATIRRWRLFRQGPKYLKIGAVSVRYKAEDLTAWLESCQTGGGEPVEAVQ